MEWWEFLERYPDWSATTIRTKITRLQDLGTGEEVVMVVRDLQDPKCKAYLVRKAMRWGVRFTSGQIEALEQELPLELCVELREYAGQPQWQSWETL